LFSVVTGEVSGMVWSTASGTIGNDFN